MNLDPITPSDQGSPASLAVASVDTNPTTVSIKPEEPPMIQFTTPQALEETIYQVTGDAIYVKGVNATSFKLLEDFRNSSNRKYRFKRYYLADELLIITIPTRTHEIMHVNLMQLVTGRIILMGLEEYWQGTAAITFKSLHGGSKGEGDSGGGPLEPNESYKGKWPTLVIEAGYSMSIGALRQEMRWWFHASDHRVKIVLLMKATLLPNRQLSSLLIEKWKELRHPGRAGATTTRSMSHLEPQLIQSIIIERNLGSTNPNAPESYTVTSGELRLAFEDLFLRPPRQGEHDVVITIRNLQWVASRIGDLED
ncbi:unnamed protein product [Clonostachys rosea f. rosea IK726]|uniref:Uncharacterized protein n=2 Tax=Bionectria ochroleuca TaxID=29856 RepID=A0A0B7JWY7_BIOOC|nr:unnamed protein product [Clonostachys rosea f. rosea IK726]